MTSNDHSAEASSEPAPQSAKAVDDQLIEELVGRAQAEGLQLTGEAGLLQQLTKRLLESALESEVTDHHGHDRHDPAGKNDSNSRNGTHSKTMLPEVSPVKNAVPRDRDGTFEPKIVKKRQRRLTDVDETVISLAAKEKHRMAPKKDDAFDAFVLADSLCHEFRHWRPLPVASPQLAELRAVIRDRERVVWNQRDLENQLRAILQSYHPAVLHLFLFPGPGHQPAIPERLPHARAGPSGGARADEGVHRPSRVFRTHPI